MKATFGKMYAFSFMKSSNNVNTAFQVASTMTAPSFLPILGSMLYLPSVRRDIIARGSTDPYIDVFNKAALVSNGWLDIEPMKSRQILSGMVQNITSGKVSVSEGIQDIEDLYNVQLKATTQ